MEYPRLTSVAIDGYRPFRDFVAELGPLEIIVGANGVGKSSLFEFLKIIRNGIDEEFLPGLVPGGSLRQIYHTPGVEKITWELMLSMKPLERLAYGGELTGPHGQHVACEYAVQVHDADRTPLLEIREGQALYNWSERSDLPRRDAQRLGLGRTTYSSGEPIGALLDYIQGWRFHDSFQIASDAISRPVITGQDPVLREDAANLSDVLQYLRNEHESAFKDLNHYLRLLIPGFESLRVKPYGAPGEVMAFWKEQGVDRELSLADLSDGNFRLLCWIVLCIVPNPPSLICIDEPDLGVHPRTLAVLAALFQKASRRTQILLTTHNSYFLSMFDFSQIAVIRKESGRAIFVKPDTSKALVGMIEDFGVDEIERLHKSEELEGLP